jgi:hypothetical protein
MKIIKFGWTGIRLSVCALGIIGLYRPITLPKVSAANSCAACITETQCSAVYAGVRGCTVQDGKCAISDFSWCPS